MLGSVLPSSPSVGGRDHIGSVTTHILGSFLGGLTLGVCLLAVRASIPLETSAISWLIFGAIILILSLRELGVLNLPLPQIPRQVPNDWRYRYSRRSSAFRYGVALGFGFLTPIATGLTYALPVYALTAGAADALLVGVMFGLGRTIPLVLAGTAAQGDAERLAAMGEELHRVRAVAPTLASVALAAFAGGYFLLPLGG